MKKEFHSPDYYYGASQVLKHLLDRVRFDKDIISKNDLVVLIYREYEDNSSVYNEQQKIIYEKTLKEKSK